jgi:hypothetical protein
MIDVGAIPVWSMTNPRPPALPPSIIRRLAAEMRYDFGCFIPTSSRGTSATSTRSGTTR